jgi:hypothetical protein
MGGMMVAVAVGVWVEVGVMDGVKVMVGVDVAVAVAVGVGVVVAKTASIAEHPFNWVPRMMKPATYVEIRVNSRMVPLSLGQDMRAAM